MPRPEGTDYRVSVDPGAPTTTPGKTRIGQTTDLSLMFKIAEQAAGAVRAELMGEIRALTPAMRENEAQRSMDVQGLTHALQDTPKLSEIKRENRHAIGWAVGIVLRALALPWTVFGVGASTTSGFADRVLGEQQEQQAEQIRDKRIDDKLNAGLKDGSSGQPNGNAVQPPPEGNVVGNRT